MRRRSRRNMIFQKGKKKKRKKKRKREKKVRYKNFRFNGQLIPYFLLLSGEQKLCSVKFYTFFSSDKNVEHERGIKKNYCDKCIALARIY